MKLTEAEAGHEYCVTKFHSGREMHQHLHEMGLTLDCDFTVVINNNGGPILIEIRGTRLAIGHGMANKIEVERIS